MQASRLLLRSSVQEPAQQPLYFSELGTDKDTDQIIELGDIERRSGLYILGRTGVGKSTLIVNLALQDIAHGHGIFFLDPHADATKDSALRNILSRLPRGRKQDVLFFNITDKDYSFGINLVACDDPSDMIAREDAYVKAYEVFHSLWPEEFNRGVLLEEIVTYLLRAFIENPGLTLADAPRFLHDGDPAFRRQVLSNIHYDRQTADFWKRFFSTKRAQDQEKEVEAALRRFDILLSSPFVRHVVDQKKTTLDFSQFMNERKIVLVSFPANLPSNTKRFLGTILVRELLWAARARKGDYSQFCLFVDEFQNFITPDFANIIRETRKFGIAPTLAQQLSLGDEFRIVGEAIDAMANKIVFQPTRADAERNAKEFAKRPEPAQLRLIEEESIEILQEEELVWNEWEEGLKPVLEPRSHLAAYLQKQGYHKDQRVDNFIEKYLEPNQGNLDWYNRLLTRGVRQPETIGQIPEATRQALFAGNPFIQMFFGPIEDYAQFDLDRDELEEHRSAGYSDEHKRQTLAMLARMLSGGSPLDGKHLLSAGGHTVDEDEDAEEEGSSLKFHYSYIMQALHAARSFFAELEADIAAEVAEHPDMTAEDIKERIREYLSHIDPQVILKPVLVQALKKARAAYNRGE